MRGRGYYFARWCCYCHMQRCCHEAVLCPRCNAGRASYDASRLGRSLMSFLVGARAGYSWTVPSAMPGLLYRRRYSPPAVTGSPPLRRAVGHSHGPGLGLAHGQPVAVPPRARRPQRHRHAYAVAHRHRHASGSGTGEPTDSRSRTGSRTPSATQPTRTRTRSRSRKGRG